MKNFEKLLAGLEPGETLEALLPIIRTSLSHLDEDARVGWVTRLIGERNDNSLSGLVNL